MKEPFRYLEVVKEALQRRSIRTRLSLILIFISIIVLYITMIGSAVLLFFQGFDILLNYDTMYGGGFFGILRILMAFVIIRGLIVWKKPHKGYEITREDEPELFFLIEDVAKRVGTEMADEVRLYPNSAIGVYETSNLLRIFFPGRRMLMLGIASIPALTVSEFKAILAHEFAHFSRRDTFYNRFIARAGFAFSNVLSGLRLNILWVMNPIYWYLYFFYYIFLSLVGSFSRQREFSADAIAARVFGSECFSSALKNYSIDSSVFEGMSMKEAVVYANEGKYIENIYDYHRKYKAQLPSHVIESMEKKVSTISETPFQTHPPLQQRIGNVTKLGYETDCGGNQGSASLLFQNSDQIEKKLTLFLYSIVLPRALEGIPVKVDQYQFGFDEKRLRRYADEFIERLEVIIQFRLEYSQESLKVVDELIRRRILLVLGVDIRYLTYLIGSYLAVVIQNELGGEWNPYGKEGPILEKIGGFIDFDVNPFPIIDASLRAQGGASLYEFYRGLKSRLLSGAF
jgi:Zn-dependent protease with chaperone function